jgi:hypothetical protein
VKRGWRLALIGANLLVVLALALAFPHLMLSPGALAPAHASLARDCFACHAPWHGAAAPRCAACHVVADIGVRTTTGAPIARRNPRPAFHQQLVTRDCVACHREHAGSATGAQSRKPFSHSLLRAQLRERCADCHVPPAGPLHAGAMAACGQCHDTARWTPATFDHARLFPLVEPHRANCTTCHPRGEYRQYTCYGCHEHTPDRVRAEHAEEGIARLDDCVECHRGGAREAGGGD